MYDKEPIWYLQTSDGQYIEGTYWEIEDILKSFVVKWIKMTEGYDANGVHYYMAQVNG